MIRRTFLATLLSFSLLLLGSCGYPSHIDPPIYLYPNAGLTYALSYARAADIGGLMFVLLDTHSMEPLLQGDDRLVVETSKGRPYSSLIAGEIIAYRADWAPEVPMVHRLISKDKDGWILSGDANVYSESGWRVNEATYIGVVIEVYRVGAPVQP